MNTTKILYKRIWYLPTYLKNKTDTKCTLIGHVYTIKKTKSGNILLDNKIDAWEFNNEENLAQFIKENKAIELPIQADGDPKFVPERLKNRVKKLQTMETP